MEDKKDFQINNNPVEPEDIPVGIGLSEEELLSKEISDTEAVEPINQDIEPEEKTAAESNEQTSDEVEDSVVSTAMSKDNTIESEEDKAAFDIRIEGLQEESEKTSDTGIGNGDEEEEEEITHPPLPDPDIYYLEAHEISAYCLSQQGDSHIFKGVVCQDRSGIRVIEERGIVISAIADGVGSCSLSDIGAECAVSTGLNVCEISLRDTTQEITPAEMGKLLRKAMKDAYDAVELLADERDILPYAFQSTLTIAIYDGCDLYMGHAGDDGIVVISEDGGCHLATVRHKGEESSSVFPLQSTSTWQFGMASHIAAYFMCTDGVLDGFVRDETEKNRVYFPFIEAEVSETLSDYYQVEKKCNERSAVLCSAEYRERVVDDLTFVAVVNQKKMADTRKNIKFDRNKWNADTAAFNQERQEKVKELEKQQSEALRKKVEDKKVVIGNHEKTGMPAGSNQAVKSTLAYGGTYVEGYTKQAHNSAQAVVAPAKKLDPSKYGEGYTKQPSSFHSHNGKNKGLKQKKGGNHSAASLQGPKVYNSAQVYNGPQNNANMQGFTGSQGQMNGMYYGNMTGQMNGPGYTGQASQMNGQGYAGQPLQMNGPGYAGQPGHMNGPGCAGQPLQMNGPGYAGQPGPVNAQGYLDETGSIFKQSLSNLQNDAKSLKQFMHTQYHKTEKDKNSKK